MRRSDEHWDLIGARSYRIAAAALHALDAHRAEYVLGGGWAVYAYEPSTPSVDFDAFLPGGRYPSAVEDELASAGFHVGARKEIEALALDRPVEIAATGDPDLGIPTVAYVPQDLFAGRVVQRSLRLGEDEFTVPAPTRDALAITKLAALRGRSIGYAIHEDASVLALLDPSTANMMRALPQSYYLRKAGKDLFDVGVLLAGDGTVQSCRTLAQRIGLWPALTERLPLTPTAVQQAAVDMAERVGVASPRHVLALE